MDHPESFEDILQACLDECRAGADVKACLLKFPEHAEALAPLLEVADELRRCPLPVLSNAARAAACDRAHAALSRRAAVPPPRLTVWTRTRPRRFAVACAAALLLALGGLWSGVAAAQRSLPGDLLYGVKRGSERLRLDLASSPAHTAALCLEFATRRVDETLGLVAVGRAPDPAVLSDLAQDYEEAWQSVLHLPPAERNPFIARYKEEVYQHREKLAAALIRPTIPSARVLLERALGASEAAAGRLSPSPGDHALSATPVATSIHRSATALATPTAVAARATQPPAARATDPRPGGADRDDAGKNIAAQPTPRRQIGTASMETPRPSAAAGTAPPSATTPRPIKPTETTRPAAPLKTTSPTPVPATVEPTAPRGKPTPAAAPKPIAPPPPSAPPRKPRTTAVPRPTATPRSPRQGSLSSDPTQSPSLDPTPQSPSLDPTPNAGAEAAPTPAATVDGSWRSPRPVQGTPTAPPVPSLTGTPVEDRQGGRPGQGPPSGGKPPETRVPGPADKRSPRH